MKLHSVVIIKPGTSNHLNETKVNHAKGTPSHISGMGHHTALLTVAVLHACSRVSSQPSLLRKDSTLSGI